MNSYLILCRFTEHGIKNIKDSPKRVTKAKELFKSMGVEVDFFYAMMGKYDTVMVVSAKDDQTISTACLSLSSLGNVHTETHRIFSEDEYVQIVDKIK